MGPAGMPFIFKGTVPGVNTSNLGIAGTTVRINLPGTQPAQTIRLELAVMGQISPVISYPNAEMSTQIVCGQGSFVVLCEAITRLPAGAQWVDFLVDTSGTTGIQRIDRAVAAVWAVDP